MKKIIFIIAILLCGYISYSQQVISAKSIQFPTVNSILIKKWSSTINGIDSLCATCVPTTNAVYQWVKTHSGSGTADSSIFSTNYRRDTAIANVRTQIAALQASLLFDFIHSVTSTNTTPVTLDTLALVANTQATYHLTFHGFDNTGVLNNALWYERRVLVKYSDGAVPTPYVQVIGTDIAEGTLNAVPPPVTFVVSGTLVFIKVASPSTMNIPWKISRTLIHVSDLTAH